jgi:hypothetical protein
MKLVIDDAGNSLVYPVIKHRIRSVKMTVETKSKNYVWVIVMILSGLFLLWTVPLLLLSGGTAILEQGLKLAESSLVAADIEASALGYFNMAMLKPLWEELWIGIVGTYLALALRQGKSFAWGLSLFWGIMLITNAVIQGVYEVRVLNWSNACLQTYLFLLIGSITVVSLLITRKGYLLNQPSPQP